MMPESMVNKLKMKRDQMAMAAETILELRNLKTHFHTPEGVVKAVDGVSYALNAGETLGVVGESGCGKSVTALSILGLIPQPPGEISGDGIYFGDQDLTALSAREMRRIRGNQISMIFQEPMTSLNPVLTVGFQIAEAITRHQELTRKTALERAVDMLGLVGIPLPQQRAKEYPHQLSGGMRQRAMIAMALSCQPKILLADEPTTALDVTIQAQILDLMLQLKDETGTAIILITHDLGLVAETCERVVVIMREKLWKRHRWTMCLTSPYTHTPWACCSLFPNFAPSRNKAPARACKKFPVSSPA